MSQINSKPAELFQVSDNYYPIEESSQYRFGINLDVKIDIFLMLFLFHNFETFIDYLVGTNRTKRG